MKGPQILNQMLLQRWRGLLGWTLGTSALVAVMALVYPTIRQAASSLDEYVKVLPPALREAFGLSAIGYSTPAGYLSTELYSAMFPVVMIVLGISLAAWTIAGSESDGNLELTLSTPASRVAVAVWRYVGVAAATAAVIAVATLTLVVLAPSVGLDAGLEGWSIWAAGLDMWAMCLVFTTATFAIGATLGRRGAAVAAGAALAVIGYVAQLLGSLAESLQWMRTASPWWWFLEDNPLVSAPGWQSLVLPLAVCLTLVVASVAVFNRRDLHL